MLKRILFTLIFSISALIPIGGTTANAETKTVNFLLPCVSSETFCIEGISARLADGSLVKGAPSGRSRNEILSVDDSFLKYLSGPVAEWNFPGITFQNGTSRALLFSYYWPADNLHCWNDGNCSLNEEELGIYLRGSNFDSSRPPVILTGSDAALACPKTPTYCNIGTPPWMIDQNVTFEISLRMAADFQPLYSQGRLKNLLVEPENVPDQPTRKIIKVSFTPVKLQNVYFASANPGLIQKSLYVTDEPALWIYGLKNSKSNSLGFCGKTGGLQVTSNAYFMWNPSWNAASQSIDVKLESTHFDIDGTTSKGLLQVRISTEMAKCLWSVDLQGNVKASVAIDYGNGDTPEIVTIVGNLKGNYFEFTAANFHFSAPTLKLKITGDPQPVTEQTKPELKITGDPQPVTEQTKPEPPKVEPISQKVGVQQIVKKTSVSCVKGKVVKKITAINPKCPAGYKKK